MSTKLNEDAMRSELAGSGFFQSRRPAINEDIEQAVEHPDTPAAKTESLPPRAHATMPPSNTDDPIAEMIRRTVKQIGKEEATYRLTAEEKKAVTDIVYEYGNAGIRTNNNEVTRIGLNYLLEDYRENGQASLLARVLERLNA